MLDRRNFPTIPRLILPARDCARECALMSRWVSVGSSCEIRACLVNVQALEPDEKPLLDDGDLLPRWGYFWMTLAAHLIQANDERGLAGAMIIPREPARKTEVLELTVSDVAGALAGDGWWHDAGVILAWGIAGQFLSKPKFPLPCLGAIAPTADGLAAVSITSSEAVLVIPEWFGGTP